MKIETIYMVAPTSCRCGGSYAWLKKLPSGAYEMIGCVCHHTPEEILGKDLKLED